MSSNKEDLPDLPRDINRLFKKYTRLRYSLYGKYKNGFSFIPSKSAINSYASKNHAEIEFPDIYRQQELKEYIDEQTIRLILEYDPNGAVDFPGYVYSKLSKRVRGSYMESYKRDIGREQVGYSDDEVTKKLEDVPNYDGERYKELVLEIMHKLTDKVDKDIFKQLVNDNKTNYAVYRYIHNKYPEVKRSEFDSKLHYIQKLSVDLIKKE